MVITLSGTNDFARTAELNRLETEFVRSYGGINLELIDGEEATLEKIQQALNSMPFLADKKLVVLRAPSANKQFIEAAESLLGDVPETNEVILVEPKLDKRLSYYKFLKKATDFREFNELDENSLARWLSDSAQEKGVTLNAADARFLVERLGTNQELLKNSLDVLILAGPEISRATIEKMTEPTPQSKVFDLLEAAFNGHADAALKIYDDQRAQKVEPAVIISMITWQLRVLATIKAAGQTSPAEIAKNSKLNPYVISKNSSIARRLQLGYIKQLVSDLLGLDVRLKTEPIDPDEALRFYLLQVAQQ